MCIFLYILGFPQLALTAKLILLNEHIISNFLKLGED